MMEKMQVVKNCDTHLSGERSKAILTLSLKKGVKLWTFTIKTSGNFFFDFDKIC